MLHTDICINFTFLPSATHQPRHRPHTRVNLPFGPRNLGTIGTTHPGIFRRQPNCASTTSYLTCSLKVPSASRPSSHYRIALSAHSGLDRHFVDSPCILFLYRNILNNPSLNMSFQKPEKDFGEGPKIHKIRITLTSRKVQSLEKVCSELLERAKSKQLRVKGPVRLPTKVLKVRRRYIWDQHRSRKANGCLL